MLESYGSLHKNDPIEKRLQLLIALFECADSQTTKALRRQLEVVYNIKKPP
jgi:hypothetical protein